ncbi:10995_t:CDS:2 [Funneliformis caledonium]|uniref:10995_t:CDS:1 n=1 Tax=Funneliformis caledonium TaxID=1117310 RepID=A0A9N9HLJ7_9GLOM|nr:10995_t:CDS:2 [Funneliformis caledonium]
MEEECGNTNRASIICKALNLVRVEERRNIMSNRLVEGEQEVVVQNKRQNKRAYKILIDKLIVSQVLVDDLTK